jgi:hypothetical protein
MTNIINFKPVLAIYTCSYDVTLVLSFLKRERERFMNVSELFKFRKAQKRSWNVHAVNNKRFEKLAKSRSRFKNERITVIQNNNQGFKNVI